MPSDRGEQVLGRSCTERRYALQLADVSVPHLSGFAVMLVVGSRCMIAVTYPDEVRSGNTRDDTEEPPTICC
jgi:hypothetical protein